MPESRSTSSRAIQDPIRAQLFTYSSELERAGALIDQGKDVDPTLRMSVYHYRRDKLAAQNMGMDVNAPPVAEDDDQ